MAKPHGVGCVSFAQNCDAFPILLLANVKATHRSFRFIYKAETTMQCIPDLVQVAVFFSFETTDCFSSRSVYCYKQMAGTICGIVHSLQAQMPRKYSLYALYEVAPVYGRTGSGCLMITMGQPEKLQQLLQLKSVDPNFLSQLPAKTKRPLLT